MPPSMTLAELATELECRLEGDGTIEITGVSDLFHAQPGDLSFFGNARYRRLVDRSHASALIVGDDAELVGRALLRASQPYYSFARALELFYPPQRPAAGISSLAVVAADAHIADDVSIGPFVVIGAGARIGDRTIIHSHVSIGSGAIIGADCILHSHVAVRERVTISDRVVVQDGAVIGSDGFGFTPGPDGRHYKIPQVGTVVVEEDVEIGANTTIDRAAVGETRIAAGSKIDNLVQVAHNVRIGRDVLLAAQVGIAGSTMVGEGMIAAARSGITGSIEAGRFVTGYPAIDNREWRKASVVFKRLPELRQQLVALEQRLEALEAKLHVSVKQNEPTPDRRG
jgi:UDP-3-O-[3-hydroxymyristoyl] glucosamine N-acyltransferase